MGNVLEIGDWLVPNETINHTHKNLPEVSFTDKKSIKDFERHHIMEVLTKTNWKIRGVNGATKILDLNPTTLEA